MIFKCQAMLTKQRSALLAAPAIDTRADVDVLQIPVTQIIQHIWHAKTNVRDNAGMAAAIAFLKLS